VFRFSARAWMGKASWLMMLGVVTGFLVACGGGPEPDPGHLDPAGAPPHIHLEDGATVNIGLGADGDLVEKLLNNQTIFVSTPNDSVQTAAFSIPTMF